MSAVPHHYITPEEYLEIERKAEYKSEYVDGEMFAMSGVSRWHARNATALSRELANRLRHQNCDIFGSDLRIRIPRQRGYVYPDISVVCGDAEFEDNELDTLTNPILVVEILSPSTELLDRGRKFAWYQQIPTLREYVLVSQDQPRVERFVRRDDDWAFIAVESLDATLRLESIGYEVPLRDIYERVTFGVHVESEGKDQP